MCVFIQVLLLKNRDIVDVLLRRRSGGGEDFVPCRGPVIERTVQA